MSLPNFCFITSPADEKTVLEIERGALALREVDTTQTADELNAYMGVTPEQIEVMRTGQRYGWHHPDVEAFA